MSGGKRSRAACYMGYVTQAAANNLLPLLFVVFKNELGLTYEALGRLVVFNFLTQLTTDLVIGKFAVKIGYKKIMLAGSACVAAGLTALALTPMSLGSGGAYIYLCATVVVYSAGAGTLDFISAIIYQLFDSDKKEERMNAIHSLYCWGTAAVVALTVAITAFFGQGAWRWAALVWVILPVVQFALFCGSKLPEVEEGEDGGGFSVLKRPLAWLFVGVMIFAGSSEITMAQWASAFAEKGLNLGKEVGNLAGPFTFAVCMGLMRLFVGKLTKRVKIYNFMMACLCLAVLSYITCALTNDGAVAFAAFAVCGFGVAILWPTVITVAADALPGAGSALFALLTIGGDIGAAAGPWAAGAISDANGGISAGLLFGALSPAGMLVFLVLFGIYRKRRGK